MATADHTPTPWAYCAADGRFYSETDNTAIARIIVYGCLDPFIKRAEANAAFIVRAVNCHAALVGLLLEARNTRAADVVPNDWATRVDAALALVAAP